MKKFVLIFGTIVLFLGTAEARFKPSGFKEWRDSVDTKKVRVQFGGEIQNYKRYDGAWDSIQTNWTGVGPWYDTLGLFKISINDTALSTVTIRHNDTTLTLTQQPIRLMWINTSTQNTVNLFTTRNYNNVSRDSNVLKWTNMWPGVDWAVQVNRSGVAHAVVYKKAFLDSAVILYNQRADSSSIALGNLIRYTASGVDLADSAVGTVRMRRLKQIGGMAFDIDSQRVNWNGGDTATTPPPVYQKWVRIGGVLYCLEYVMMSDLKRLHVAMPNVALWHNTNVTIGAGTNDLAVTYLRRYDPTTQYGSMVTCYVGSEDPDVLDEFFERRPLLYSDTLKGRIAGNTVDACSLLVKRSSSSGTIKIYARGVKNVWSETQATWNQKVTGTNWGTAGCDNTSTDLYGTGAKYDSTTSAGDTITGSWYVYDYTTYMQACDVGDTINYQGFRLNSATEASTLNYIAMHSDDATTSSNRPKIFLYYTITSGSTNFGRGSLQEATDTHIRQNAATTNFNTDTMAYFGGGVVNGTDQVYLFTFPGLADTLYNKCVDSAKLTFRIRDISGGTANDTFNFQVVRRKDMSFTQTTWNIYKTANNWTTAGAINTTDDIFPTNYSTFYGSALTDENDYVINVTALLQAVDGTDTSSIFSLRAYTGVNDDRIGIGSTDVPTTAYRPYLQVWKHAGVCTTTATHNRTRRLANSIRNNR